MNESIQLRILIAGGGTGGHVFPGIAIARGFQRRHPQAEIWFVGTQRGIEKRIVPAEGFTLKTIPVSGLKGMRGLNLLKALWNIPWGLKESYQILREFRPRLVIGVGGYSSGPPVLVAALMGIPILLQEQNARPGITNRILSRVADRVAVAFEECRSFFGDKTILTGNPVRPDFSQLSDRRNPDRFVLLIFGGSQGSHAINQAMIEALESLEGHFSKLWFIHQTGEKDFEWVRGAYQAAGAEGEVRPFFDDMPLQFTRSDLVICRSGAITLAELAAAGKAAILVPFPFAADNHQQRNAEAMARAGAAEMILQSELSGKRLAQRIMLFLDHREALLLMEQRSRQMGHPDAVERLVSLVEEMVHV